MHGKRGVWVLEDKSLLDLLVERLQVVEGWLVVVDGFLLLDERLLVLLHSDHKHARRSVSNCLGN